MSTLTSSESRYAVVAGIDTSPAADAVIANAAASVRGRANAEIHIVHAIDLQGDPSRIPLLAEAREYLGRMGQRARETCGARVTTHLAAGEPWREIVQTAASVHADLILVATHGRSGAARLLLGSQAELVVRKASCPVLVVRKKEYATAKVEGIEPACPVCLKVQEETKGERLWCDRHSEHHPRPHLHYEFPESFGRGSMLVPLEGSS